ncbi:hypothetical protein KC573_03820 [candidate division WWE3 bacterium]|uniref:Uncharacterized protein n=1 Tax=candidate division WWE3 bacterium TaxID=2053526 RepID=A0A955LWK7_UNCKA|nr:hypothetical protein [candidate division WWE3 bacterium]
MYDSDMLRAAAKVLLTGYTVLAVAVIVNGVAKLLNMMTWYDYFPTLQANSMWELVWLWGFYPLILGMSAYIGYTIAEKTLCR